MANGMPPGGVRKRRKPKAVRVAYSDGPGSYAVSTDPLYKSPRQISAEKQLGVVPGVGYRPKPGQKYDKRRAAVAAFTRKRKGY